VTPAIAARLAACRIELLSEAKGFWILARENCIALVQLGDAGVLGIGSSGLITENGLAYLVWNEGEARLVAKGREVPAQPEQVEAIRHFSKDLKTVLARDERGS
jgi:hypothetical protein